MNLPKLTYTVMEVCIVLRISRTTLWKLIKAKKIKTLSSVGRRVLIPTDSLQEFVIKNTR
jgi:excisionase family DNA binding protein